MKYKNFKDFQGILNMTCNDSIKSRGKECCVACEFEELDCVGILKMQEKTGDDLFFVARNLNDKEIKPTPMPSSGSLVRNIDR